MKGRFVNSVPIREGDSTLGYPKVTPLIVFLLPAKPPLLCGWTPEVEDSEETGDKPQKWAPTSRCWLQPPTAHARPPNGGPPVRMFAH